MIQLKLQPSLRCVVSPASMFFREMLSLILNGAQFTVTVLQTLNSVVLTMEFCIIHQRLGSLHYMVDILSNLRKRMWIDLLAGLHMQ